MNTNTTGIDGQTGYGAVAAEVMNAALTGDPGSLSKSSSKNEEQATVLYQNTVPGPYYNMSDFWSATGRMVPYQQLTPERMLAEKTNKRRDAIASVLYSMKTA